MRPVHRLGALLNEDVSVFDDSAQPDDRLVNLHRLPSGGVERGDTAAQYARPALRERGRVAAEMVLQFVDGTLRGRRRGSAPSWVVPRIDGSPELLTGRGRHRAAELVPRMRAEWLAEQCYICAA
jgi:hypothetical protein